MTRNRFLEALVVTTLAVLSPAASAAQSADTLGNVRIPVAVKADGQPLPAGTYTLRISPEAVRSVVGQGPASAKWVEFLQGGQVRGRELASVVPPDKVKAVAKGTPPARGRAVVHTLRGTDYLRVWLNSGGTQYLVHLVR
jgi:hypothetical protein